MTNQDFVATWDRVDIFRTTLGKSKWFIELFRFHKILDTSKVSITYMRTTRSFPSIIKFVWLYRGADIASLRGLRLTCYKKVQPLLGLILQILLFFTMETKLPYYRGCQITLPPPMVSGGFVEQVKPRVSGGSENCGFALKFTPPPWFQENFLDMSNRGEGK